MDMYDLFLNPLMRGGQLFLPSRDCKACEMSMDGKYSINLKCCTYFPVLPNYSVGAILNHSSEYGKLIRSMISNRVYVLPLSLIPPPEYTQKFETSGVESFGLKSDLLCPFFNKNHLSCGIWMFRNSHCSSYFCKLNKNNLEKEYLDQYLESFYFLELALSQFMLLQLGFSWKQVEMQLDLINVIKTSTSQNKCMDEDLYESIWQEFYNREEEFFLKAYNIQKSLKFEDYSGFLGQEGIALFEKLRDFSDKLSLEI